MIFIRPALPETKYREPLPALQIKSYREVIEMKDTAPICKVALIQAEPAMFDKKSSLEKAIGYIDSAMKQKPDLIVFPELFIPGYPIGLTFGFSMGKRTEEGREDWKRYYDASVVAGGAEFHKLAEAAK